MKELSEVKPLAFKADMPEAAKRWEAFYNGDLIDRPVTLVFARKKGFENRPSYHSRYQDRVLGDMDAVIDRVLQHAEANYYGGEAVPSFCPTMGPDEMAVFCGGELHWGDGKTDTNWSAPFITDWEKDLPLKLDENNSLWKRLITFYEKCAVKMAGKMILAPIDLHSNLDLLAAARGAQNLCYDIMDTPELIDEAMVSARQVFRDLWPKIVKAGNMENMGYYQQIYSHSGAATLQCDFSIMISPESFRRWVVPALEEEASMVGHAIYHWDGYDALRHFDAVMKMKQLQTISFIPGEGMGKGGHGDHIDFLDILKKMQEHGKAVHVWGTPEQIKIMHKELDPVKVIYNTSTETQDEADALLEWLVKNT